MPRGQANSTLSVEEIEKCEENWMNGIMYPAADWMAEFHEELGVTGDAVKIMAIKKWWESTRYKASVGKLQKKLKRKTAVGINKVQSGRVNKNVALPVKSEDTKVSKKVMEVAATVKKEALPAESENPKVDPEVLEAAAILVSMRNRDTSSFPLYAPCLIPQVKKESNGF